MKPRLYWAKGGQPPKMDEISKLPRDVYIADIVGLRTYQRLWYNFPSLYTRLEECSQVEYLKNAEEGLNSNVTDMLDLHINTTYTSQDLKYDLQLMCYGFEPKNPHAKKLLNSSARSVGYGYSLVAWVIILIITVAYWIVVVLSCWLITLSLNTYYT